MMTEGGRHIKTTSTTASKLQNMEAMRVKRIVARVLYEMQMQCLIANPQQPLWRQTPFRTSLLLERWCFPWYDGALFCTLGDIASVDPLHMRSFQQSDISVRKGVLHVFCLPVRVPVHVRPVTFTKAYLHSHLRQGSDQLKAALPMTLKLPCWLARWDSIRSGGAPIQAGS